MRQSTSITGSVRRSVCWLVTHSFDDPHVAPYWPTWPCFLYRSILLPFLEFSLYCHVCLSLFVCFCFFHFLLPSHSIRLSLLISLPDCLLITINDICLSACVFPPPPSLSLSLSYSVVKMVPRVYPCVSLLIFVFVLCLSVWELGNHES